jgi:hypothetical protein
MFATSAMATVYDNVVHQAYYALDPGANNGTSSKTIGGNYVGDWNWLTSDSKYVDVRGWFGCNSSDWALAGDGSGCPALGGWVSFYANPSWYGYTNSFSPSTNWYGRGGQCVYFVNLVLYRANAYFSGLNIGTMNSQSIAISNVQPGDVVQRYGYESSPYYLTNHVAIAVQVYKSGSTVTSVDVVDSNWVNDGNANMEIIARHTLSSSDLTKFRVWRGY